MGNLSTIASTEVRADSYVDFESRIVIKAESIWRVFLQGKQSIAVVKGIDLIAYEGEIVSIIGPSGAGKSTILHILGLIDTMNQGELFLFGKNIKTFSENDKTNLRNHAIGFLFQFHYLLDEFTVLENVMLPGFIAGESKSVIYPRAMDLLARLGLENRINSLPSEISGGEQQRAALARALINHPKLILADEPTGNLDKEKGEEIRRLLWEKAEESGSTLIIVTHNNSIAKKAHRIIKMVDGKFIKD
ncbi:MAG: ABC transporter ATP-binding protein [bacterium]